MKPRKIIALLGIGAAMLCGAAIGAIEAHIWFSPPQLINDSVKVPDISRAGKPAKAFTISEDGREARTKDGTVVAIAQPGYRVVVVEQAGVCYIRHEPVK